jgi:hypothetical protein
MQSAKQHFLSRKINVVEPRHVKKLTKTITSDEKQEFDTVQRIQDRYLNEIFFTKSPERQVAEFSIFLVPEKKETVAMRNQSQLVTNPSFKIRCKSSYNSSYAKPEFKLVRPVPYPGGLNW